MNLEEYLKKNTEELQHNAPKEIWDKTQNYIKPKHVSRTFNAFLYRLIGLSLVLLLAAFMIRQIKQTQKNNAEILALKYTMTELLENQSIGKRIKAVTLSEQVDNNNQEIAQVLLSTMISDPSKNVRLAAINALGQFVDNEEVRVRIIEHLGVAKDPYVQIKLINILRKIKEKKAVTTLNYIIKDTKSVLVREKAQETMEYIKRT